MGRGRRNRGRRNRGQPTDHGQPREPGLPGSLGSRRERQEPRGRIAEQKAELERQRAEAKAKAEQARIDRELMRQRVAEAGGKWRAFREENELLTRGRELARVVCGDSKNQLQCQFRLEIGLPRLLRSTDLVPLEVGDTDDSQPSIAVTFV